MAAPKLLLDIFAFPELGSYDISSLNFMLSGSQIVSVELIERAFAKFHLNYFLIIYGMTEMLIGTTSRINNPKYNLQASSSVGKAMPFFEVKVVDKDNQSVVPLNSSGELYVKSFSVFNGYWMNPEKTHEAINSDGW